MGSRQEADGGCCLNTKVRLVLYVHFELYSFDYAMNLLSRHKMSQWFDNYIQNYSFAFKCYIKSDRFFFAFVLSKQTCYVYVGV